MMAAPLPAPTNEAHAQAPSRLVCLRRRPREQFQLFVFVWWLRRSSPGHACMQAPCCMQEKCPPPLPMGLHGRCLWGARACMQTGRAAPRSAQAPLACMRCEGMRARACLFGLPCTRLRINLLGPQPRELAALCVSVCDLARQNWWLPACLPNSACQTGFSLTCDDETQDASTPPRVIYPRACSISIPRSPRACAHVDVCKHKKDTHTLASTLANTHHHNNRPDQPSSQQCTWQGHEAEAAGAAPPPAAACARAWRASASSA